MDPASASRSLLGTVSLLDLAAVTTLQLYLYPFMSPRPALAPLAVPVLRPAALPTTPVLHLAFVVVRWTLACDSSILLHRSASSTCARRALVKLARNATAKEPRPKFVRRHRKHEDENTKANTSKPEKQDSKAVKSSGYQVASCFERIRNIPPHVASISQISLTPS